MPTPSRRTFLLSGVALPAAGRQANRKPAAVPIRYRTLGATGLKATELGFGSEAVSDVTVFERAIDAGINFFDTARPYEAGNSERALGVALRGKRQRVILSSRSYADDAKEVALDLDRSLATLETDHVDIWYLGNKNRREQVTDEMLEVQRAGQKAGKFRFRGFSTHRIGAMLDFVLEQKFDVVQIPYSYALGTRRDPFKMDAANLETALDRLKAARIGVVAMKVMAGGYRTPRIQEKNEDLFARPGVHAAAIRWALRDDRVQTTSVRMSDADQLAENLAAMSGRYTERDGKLLAAYTDAITPLFCRMCGACDGQCPQGMPVSDIVRYVTYAEAYGRYEAGAAGFARNAGAIRCGECAECAIRCPNRVRVRERMERARQLFC
jgi:uncharacterized protein